MLIIINVEGKAVAALRELVEAGMEKQAGTVGWDVGENILAQIEEQQMGETR